MPATRKTATKKAPTVKATVDSAIVNNDVINAADDIAADAAALAQEQFKTGFEALGENLTAARTQFEQAQTRLNDVNREMMDLARTEMTDAVQFANDIAKAKTFAEALTVQQSYWTNLFQTRLERTRGLTEKSVETARSAMTPAQSPFGAMFDPKAYAALFSFAPKA